MNDFEWNFKIYQSKISSAAAFLQGDLERLQECHENSDLAPEQVDLDDPPEGIDLNPKIFNDLSDLIENLNSRVFLNTLLISNYIFLEYCLKELALLIESSFENITPYHSFSGTGYGKAKKFFEANIPNFDFTTLQNSNSIYGYKSVRNCLIHDNGNIYTKIGVALEDQPLFEEFTALDGVEINESGNIYITGFDVIEMNQAQSLEFMKDLTHKINTHFSSPEEKGEVG